MLNNNSKREVEEIFFHELGEKHLTGKVKVERPLLVTEMYLICGIDL